MDDNEFLARVICEQLNSGAPVVLASIIDSSGSSPRHGGTKMVIAAGGTAYGTIGGGILEATAIKESSAVLAHGRATTLRFDMAGETALSLDPICGGQATVLLDCIAPIAGRGVLRQGSRHGGSKQGLLPVDGDAGSCGRR